MLKLSLKPGQQIHIGDSIRVIYRHGDVHGIKIVLDAPKDLLITRMGMRSDLPDTEYYRESWNRNKPKSSETSERIGEPSIKTK